MLLYYKCNPRSARGLLITKSISTIVGWLCKQNHIQNLAIKTQNFFCPCQWNGIQTFLKRLKENPVMTWYSPEMPIDYGLDHA